MNADKQANACPRCGSLFTCRANSMLRCACMGLNLSPADLRYIREYTELTFGDYSCLCITCLRTLQAEALTETQSANSSTGG